MEARSLDDIIMMMEEDMQQQQAATPEMLSDAELTEDEDDSLAGSNLPLEQHSIREGRGRKVAFLAHGTLGDHLVSRGGHGVHACRGLQCCTPPRRIRIVAAGLQLKRDRRRCRVVRETGSCSARVFNDSRPRWCAASWRVAGTTRCSWPRRAPSTWSRGTRACDSSTSA